MNAQHYEGGSPMNPDQELQFAELTMEIELTPKCESEQCQEVEGEHDADWIVWMNCRHDEYWCNARFRVYTMLEMSHGGAKCAQGHDGSYVGVWRAVGEK